MPPSAAAVMPNAPSRRHWNHKALAEQWVTGEHAHAGSRLERFWLAGLALAVGLAITLVTVWVKSPGGDIRPMVAPAPRVVQPAPAAADVDLVTQARVERMRKQQMAFLSRLAAAAEAAEKGRAAPKKAPPKAAAAAPQKTVTPGLGTAAPAQSAAPASQKSAQPAVATEKAQPATQVAAASCKLRVSDLSASGTLTYETVSRINGAHKDPHTGVVRLPPVQMDGGREAVLDVFPNGCVEIVRSRP